MRNLIASAFLVVALAACGSKSSPPPASPDPQPDVTDPSAACNLEGENGTPATAEQCECLGFEVVGDIGDGQVKCPDGKSEVSKIRYGIEGGVCCSAATDVPAAS